MSEGVPNMEGNDGAPGKSEVIESLLANPEDKEKLLAFVDARNESARNGIDYLMITVDLVDIYVGAQLWDAAQDTIKDALMQAEGEGAEDISEMLRALRSQIPMK